MKSMNRFNMGMVDEIYKIKDQLKINKINLLGLYSARTKRGLDFSWYGKEFLVDSVLTLESMILRI